MTHTEHQHTLFLEMDDTRGARRQINYIRWSHTKSDVNQDSRNTTSCPYRRPSRLDQRRRSTPYACRSIPSDQRSLLDVMTQAIHYPVWISACHRLKNSGYSSDVPLPNGSTINIQCAISRFTRTHFIELVKNRSHPLTCRSVEDGVLHHPPDSRLPPHLNIPKHPHPAASSPSLSSSTTTPSNSSNPVESQEEVVGESGFARGVTLRIQGVDATTCPDWIHFSFCDLLNLQHPIQMRWWVHMGGVNELDGSKSGENVKPSVIVDVDIHEKDWTDDSEERLKSLYIHEWCKNCTWNVLSSCNDRFT